MPHIVLAYQYFAPDDVISARIFTGLAEDLNKHGWDVTVLTSNRMRHRNGSALPASETINGVRILRLHRPDWNPDTAPGRLLSAIWITRKLRNMAGHIKAVDIVLIGSDPILGVTALDAWPHVKRVHWCFDLYPEAAAADGILSRNSWLYRTISRKTTASLQTCDLLADIGPAMRSRLNGLAPEVKIETLTPWALEEPGSCPPIAIETRKSLFQDASPAILYSGSYGRAHDVSGSMKLISSLPDARLILSIPAKQHDKVRRMQDFDQTCMRLIPPATPEMLLDRLASADIHLVSLKEKWSGMVVPSKFFAALAVGRPVLYEGSPESDIAHWVREHDVGWVLTVDNHDIVSAAITDLIRNTEQMTTLRERCHRVYQNYFRRERITGEFDKRLRLLIHEDRSF